MDRGGMATLFVAMRCPQNSDMATLFVAMRCPQNSDMAANNAAMPPIIRWASVDLFDGRALAMERSL